MIRAKFRVRSLEVRVQNAKFKSKIFNDKFGEEGCG